jgi:hypothetical protein
MVTSSNVLGAHPLLNVQRKTTVLPGATPVTVVNGEDVSEILAPPPPGGETNDHVPVIEGGFTAAIAKVELSHWVISGPADAGGGAEE